MSSAGITFGGLASGLDTKAIIAALMAVERQPITALEDKKTELTTEKGLFGDLGGLLDTLRTAAQRLAHTTDFLTMKATASDTLLSATATRTAHAGTHDVVVQSLAAAQISRSNGFASKDAAIISGGGTIFLNGSTLPVEIPANSSLQGVADAINAANQDVTADIVDTGAPGSERYNLVLRSRTTGSAGGFTLVNDSGPTATDLQALVDGINSHTVVAASDARVTIDGIDITRTSNSIDDAIPGVTLDLHAADATKHVTVTVGTDAEDTSKNVQAFVDAYNKVVDFIADQNALDANGKAKNPLFGDSTLRSIRSSLRSIVGGSVATGDDAYAMFAQVGITSDRDGRLTFDSGKFTQALAGDAQAVTNLFADAAHGIAARLDTQIGVYTDSVDGLIKARSDGYARTIQDTQDQIDQGNDRLTRYEAQLQERYANLETLLGQLQSQGASLTSLSKTGS
jgi:flagellar hook-associated protein 2